MVESAPPQAISTGEWITIGLTAAGLIVAVAGIVIAWKMLRRPATTITAGFWKVERFSSGGLFKDAIPVRGVLQVSGLVAFSPMGTSFMINGMKCVASAAGRSIILEAVQDHLNEVHQGGMSLPFMFRESGTASLLPDSSLVDIEVWIRLADGSNVHDRQTALAVTGQVIQVESIQFMPERTPLQMVKRRYNLARRAISKVWDREKHEPF
ncbi:MAG: hypothetical protein WBD55_04635 [Dehalococcoidia bacterium]